MVLVDTPVWSELFRRFQPQDKTLDALETLITNDEALIIGNVRQEILSGIKDPSRFHHFRANLANFEDEPTLTSDHETAAAMFNACRIKGIQGSNTDFLICAVSQRLGAPIFTLDRDFEAFAKVLPIELFSP